MTATTISATSSPMTVAARPFSPPSQAAAATMSTPSDAERAAFWRSLGAGDDETAELLAYARNRFVEGGPITLDRVPLDDELFVSAWQAYAAEGSRIGVAETLTRRLVQLRFPVAEGMSKNDAYLAATRRGEMVWDGPGVTFERPELLRLFLHQSPAGKIGVIVAPARADFVTLVRALTRRNEPDAIPPSMGACVVAGYNNWDRVEGYRRVWAARRAHTSVTDWAEAFAALIPQKARYQDRFVILSDGPYSAVPAETLGLNDEEWRATSLAIRLEHECAHYFTRRKFGAMQNAILDELIADYTGIVAGAGSFHASWQLRFLGLENFPAYRVGGRLENYRGNPALSDGAFTVLQKAVVRAANNLESFDQSRATAARGLVDRALTIAAIASVGLEGLAADDGPARLQSELRAVDGMSFLG